MLFSFTDRFWRLLLTVFFCFSAGSILGQTLGGKTAYNFLRLPSSPMQAAAGGVNVSYEAGEVGFTAANPALLEAGLHKQLHLSFNDFIAGTKAAALAGAWFSEKQKTSFGAYVHYLDYGSLPATDAAGNVQGEFKPVDFVVQLAAAKNYLENWSYGIAVKFIHSSYGSFRSAALAADVGVRFRDTARMFSASVVVKNMGAQLKTYAGQEEELPFDLEAGLTKRFAQSPFGFSLTAQRLQTFDILYNDTSFNGANNLPGTSSAFSKLVTHLVLATHVYLGTKLEAVIGYNFLQRQELRIGTEGNGLTGFSGGLRIRLPKLQVFYARSGYQKAVATNQIGLTLHLNELFGLGQ